MSAGLVRVEGSSSELPIISAPSGSNVSTNALA
jgi:hypothetical protein